MMNFTENISFNITKKMKSDLDTLGMMTEKKMSELLRELIILGLNKINVENGNYDRRKSSIEPEHYCFD